MDGSRCTFPEIALRARHSKNRAEVIRSVLDATPERAYYFLNEGNLRDTIRVFKEEFLPEMPERAIHYAMKANSHMRIIEVLAQGGVDGFDCASINEIHKALEYAAPENILLNNPIASQEAVAKAYQKGVRYFVAQSRDGMERLLGALPDADKEGQTEITVRVECSNSHATINLSEKFGCVPEEAIWIIDDIRKRRPDILCAVSTHVGSQNENPTDFGKGIRTITDIARAVGGVTSLNMGGGLPVDYFNKGLVPLPGMLKHINGTVRENLTGVFRESKKRNRFIMEPGRRCVAESIDLTVPVVELALYKDEKRLYIADGVYGAFSDSVIHGWKYWIDVITGDGRILGDETEAYNVFGHTCDSKDCLGILYLPKGIKRGDHLWIRNAGAYMDSQASRFHDFPKPHYILYNC